MSVDIYLFFDFSFSFPGIFVFFFWCCTLLIIQDAFQSIIIKRYFFIFVFFCILFTFANERSTWIKDWKEDNEKLIELQAGFNDGSSCKSMVEMMGKIRCIMMNMRNNPIFGKNRNVMYVSKWDDIFKRTHVDCNQVGGYSQVSFHFRQTLSRALNELVESLNT